jgi:hypothetical protein
MATQSTARTVRAIPQGGAAWILVSAIEEFNIYDFTDSQFGLAVFILTPVIAWIQIQLENRLGKGFLRVPTNKPEVEVVEPS